MKTIPLREVAHSRSGEKGNKSTLSVIAYDRADYEILRQQVTVDRVRELYGPITKGEISRYEVPLIGALNFVLDEALEGGRTRTLAFEESGKALSSLMLTLPLQVPADYIGRSQRRHTLQTSGADSPAAPAGGQCIRLGSATAWSRDRFDCAAELIREKSLDYLCFEAMSEVTMSAARVAGLGRSDAPLYDPYLVERMEPILRECREKGIRIISNQGWLDPVGAAKRIAELAESLGIADYKIAAVTGGDLTGRIAGMGLSSLETGEPLTQRRDDIVSAEAYLGAGGIVDALRGGAEFVITTRIADGALYLGPLAYEFDWDVDDYEAMARGMVVGHLMECGTQISGGYFCDPGYKDVPGLAELGSPIAEVTRDEVIITKTAGSGGIVSTATCAEQLLYEVEDPANYLCPDCVADFTQVGFEQAGADRVRVLIGAVGKPRTPYLKALVGVKEGFMTEEMVIFAGPGALERAQMTEEILRQRFGKIDLVARDIRFDYLGVNAVHREATPATQHTPYEVILRIALKTDSLEEANKLRREVDPLAVNGLAGTGKWATSSPGSRVQPVIGLLSCLVPREEVQVSVVSI